MNAKRNSDESKVQATSANKDAAEAKAEPIEERDSATRNDVQADLPRTPSRTLRKSSGLHGVREAARKDSKLRFTALLHHVNFDFLYAAFLNLQKTATVGVDEVTWHEYEQNVEAHIKDLHERTHRGAYRELSLRIHILKPDGRTRPLGIASPEDKIVHQTVVWVLQSIYEQNFVGFSYGFRPGRSQHNALDALSVAITSKKLNWILDADIEGFFHSINHEWLIKFLERRIGESRILRLIRKWLRAGVSEDGEWSPTTVGTLQGAVASPLLANVYLHYVFDLWIQWWRKSCRGDVVIVRYADDFVIGFENLSEATACLEALYTRFAQFGLKLHKDKTRLTEFGTCAIERRERHSESRPETFNFLGFTHKCAQTKEHGRFTIHRHSIAKRVCATLQKIKEQLRKRMHRPIGETGRWLRRVVQGWLNYHAVPSNSHCLCRFVDEVTRLCFGGDPSAESAWSQQVDMGTNAAARPSAFASSPHHPSLSIPSRLSRPFLSRPTQGRSRMKESFKYGSVRGAAVNSRPCLDRCFGRLEILSGVVLRGDALFLQSQVHRPVQPNGP